MIRGALAVLLALVVLAPASAGAKGFTVGIEMPSQVPVSPAVESALRDMGIGYINYYLNTSAHAGDMPAQEVNKHMVALCDSLGLDFSIACHVLDPPRECVQYAARQGRSRFKGIVFDEPEHCRLLNNYGPAPLADSSKFETLAEAYQCTLKGFRAQRARFPGTPVVSTHVWPVMHHISARAGFTVCPKICKEFYSPVSLAVGMGAAKQYSADLWVNCDLWFWGLVPGHPPDEVKSNLLLAYWLGADLVYIEGAGHNLMPAGKQGLPFSLISQPSPDTCELTPHGEALRWFCKEYLPAHPRKWTFRDVKPNIAIIRFEDTCHGQRYTADFKDHLYGSDKLRSTSDTEAWLGLWNLLTFGKTGRDGLSLFKSYVALAGYQWRGDAGKWQSYLDCPVMADQHRFFVPLNGVVAYDHLVKYDLLKGIPLLFLTGTEISAETMSAVRRCVGEGAVCVAWGPLAAKHGFPDWKSGVVTIPEGKGRFVLTDDFGLTEVYNQTKSFLGRPDEIKYRFGDHEVILRRVTDNQVSVETRALTP